MVVIADSTKSGLTTTAQTRATSREHWVYCMKKLMIFFVAFCVLLFLANFKHIAAKFSTKMVFDHSDFGIDGDPSETDEHFGQNNIEEEDGYYLEPTISLREKMFCRGGAGKAASCKERPLNPYWESWTAFYGDPDRDGSVAKQEYQRKYTGRQTVKRTD